MSDLFNNILNSDEFREEHFVSSVQSHLNNLLEESGVSRAELARKLGVSRPRVTQIFSDEAKNLTLRLLVRCYLAVDEEPVLISKSEYERLRTRSARKEESRKGARDRVALPDGMSMDDLNNLLKATVPQSSKSKDAQAMGRSNARDWVSGGSNVVRPRRWANG